VATAQRKRSTAKRKPAARKKDPDLTAIERLLSRADTWGVLFVLAGILGGLGIWFDRTGALGQAMRDGADSVVGVARYGVPVALVWVGALLIHDSHQPGPSGRQSGERDTHEARRSGIGFGLLLLAGTGFAHLADDAGGLLGRAVAGPLESIAAVWGASIVLLVIGLAGVLVLTETTVSAAAHHTVNLVRPIGGALRGGVRWLTSVGERRAEARAADDATEIDALDSMPDPLPEPVINVPEHEPVAEAEVEDDVDDEPIELHVPLDPEQTEQLDMALGPAAAPQVWKLPPLSMLKRSEVHAVDQRAVQEAGRTLEMALAAHGVDTRLVGATVGPTVTRFELELGPGVKVNRVTSLSKDIAYAMASPDVRILAPIPGRSAIGVEVPNTDRQLVAVGDILASEEAKRATHPCEVALGRDIAGRSVMVNLAQMPHILIAGATGAGKSSCINTLITSLLMRTTPEQLRMILVDPKRVELGQYNGLPHLLTPVVVNPKKAANALSWAVKEMERRYDLLSEVGVRDITGYNAAYDRGELEDVEPQRLDEEKKEYKRLPFVIIVVDELNDLMMVAARDVEESICRIAQMARAVGIHLVIATQRPSVNVITGVIKANIPARLAFAVSTMADSRVILDQGGAERLVGKGDLLLLGPASSHPRRIQGSWVTEEEVRKVVGHWRRQSTVLVYEKELADDAEGGLLSHGSDGGSDDDDDLLLQAMELVVRSQLGSTSMLQRKLRVGFARAGRLMDLLEQKGVVGPSTGSKAREVLMTPEELELVLAAKA
jgi:S-DNA-T family DNA segregation ATPase FtsK/SpoIIIE